MEARECPSCGAPATASDRRCVYCRAEFFVTSLAYLGRFGAKEIGNYVRYYKEQTRKDPSSAEGLLGLGLCHLQMGMYPLAEKSFEQLIDGSPDVPQAYYYWALSNIRGRRLKAVSLAEVRRLENYLMTAVQLDDQAPHYKLLLAMLKRDYYEANGLRIPPPTAQQILADINGKEANETEIERLRECVRVANPEIYFDRLDITTLHDESAA